MPAVGVMWIPSEDRDWPSALLGGFWMFLLGPPIQLLGFAAFIAQVWKTRRSVTNDALSVQGLVAQAVVFFLVGTSFFYRYRVPPEELSEHFIVDLRDWYWSWGWATMNNVVFAVGQGMLAWLMAWRRRETADGQRTALLSG